MVNRLMLWAADNPRLERTIHNNKTFGRIVHRFIAGDELEDALAAAKELNAPASAVSRTCSVRVWRILPVPPRREQSTSGLYRQSLSSSLTRQSR